LFHELEIVEKHCLDRHGSKKKFKTITKRNKVHRAKKSTNETKKDEKADETKVYDCAYCKFQDRTKNGLKCHLSSNVHSAQDLYDRTLRSHEELKKSLPYKCLVCHARFIELNRLKAHIETHDKTELLDRCLDFSESLRKYEEPAEPKYEEPDLNAMASNMPSEVIVTDSDSMSDEDSDEHVSAMIDVPEPDSDYLIIEPVEPYERGTSIFNPLPPFKQPEVSPGVKCYICEAILEDDADRRKHLTVDHKIAKNHHLLSFRSRQMHREMELLDMVSNLKETGTGAYR